MQTKYNWNSGMLEIFGGGGSYEATLQMMVDAGLQWHDANPGANPNFIPFLCDQGLLTPENKDAEEFLQAIHSVVPGGHTSTMSLLTVAHCKLVRQLGGWDKYVEESIRRKKEQTAKKAAKPVPPVAVVVTPPVGTPTIVIPYGEAEPAKFVEEPQAEAVITEEPQPVTAVEST